MIASALLAMALQTSAGFTAGRYELSERVRKLEMAWLATSDRQRRRSAVEAVNAASSAIAAGRGTDAARSFDEAIAALEGRRLRSSDALNIRPDRPISEPAATVTLRVTWAYRPSSVIPVRVGVSSQEIDVRPGSTATLNVSPWIANPELRLNQEVGYLMPVRVGNETRLVYLSFVRRYEERLRRLSGSTNPFVSDLAKLVDAYQSNPETMETELPLVQYIFSAETIEDGKAKASDIEQVYYGRNGSTALRAAFPKRRTEAPITVVLSVHGEGGSENSFFEAYGRGLAVSKALERGWAFVSVRAGASCLEDALAWLGRVRGVKVDRLFLLGHGTGGSIVLSSRDRLGAAGSAVFAPPVRSLEGEGPLFVAIGSGAPGSGQLAGVARSLSGKEGFEYREVELCESMLVAVDSLAAAFSFFDRLR